MKQRQIAIAILLFSSVFIGVHLRFLPLPTRAQQAEQEMVANLAAGRVVIYMARDAIVFGAFGSRVEAEAQPPRIVPLPGRRIGILLGAAEWSLAAGQETLRLDREVSRVAGEVSGAGPRLQVEQAGDLESIGLGLLERLRSITQQIHRKLDLRPDEPLLELLIIGYVPDYGPEVWSLRYRLVQEALRGNYYRTRILRPSYVQLYPPKKGQPLTLVEAWYPPEDPGPPLVALLKQNDPRLARLPTADPAIARAMQALTRGESNKAIGAEAGTFLQAALGAIAPQEMPLVIGFIDEIKGLQWILAPPEPLQKVEDTKPREPGAPTLRKKP